jgi:hypothetical protein
MSLKRNSANCNTPKPSALSQRQTRRAVVEKIIPTGSGVKHVPAISDREQQRPENEQSLSSRVA